MDRRTFIKLTAVSTTATLGGCSVPGQQLIRFIPEEELKPGLAEWKPSVCPLCSAGCGLTVKVMQADVEVVKDGQHGVVTRGVAKKLEGHPAHPVSQGGLCARGQAAIQVTYHPDRLVQPLIRRGNRASGTLEPTTWDQAITELVAKLDALAGNGHQAALTILAGGRPTLRRALFDQFAAKFGAAPTVVHEVFSDDLLRYANGKSFGAAQLPTYDLGNAGFVLGFGADFLGTWNAPVAHAAAYGRMRRGRPGKRGYFVQVEGRMTQTGAVADQWVPVQPGTEGVLALGIAHVLLHDGLRPATTGRAGALIDGWASGLPEYAPEQVAAITGAKAERIVKLAHDFAGRGPAVAIVGGTPLAHTNGLFTALAVNALNELSGVVGRSGGVLFTPQLALPVAARGSLAQLVASPPQLLIVDGANPVFSAPVAMKVRDALDRIPYIVSFTNFLDETSALADLVLPDHTFLETIAEALPESGSSSAVISIAGPVMTPLFETRGAADVLIDVAGKLKSPLDLPWGSYQEMARASLAPLGDEAWTTAQKQSGWWGELPAAATTRPTAAEPKPRPVRYAAPTFSGDVGDFPYHFLPYASAALLDGSLAHLPWLQEMPDPLTSAMWSSWVEINPKTAAQLGVALGDVVEVTSTAGTLRVPAFINPAMAPDIIAMPVGQGHHSYTRYASGRGQNPLEILAPVAHPETGTLAWAATRVKVARVSDPDGRLIMFSALGELRENPLEGETR